MNIIKRMIRSGGTDAALALESRTLEQLLDTLSQYGNPRLSLMRDGSRNDGWHCNIEMRVTSAGATFKIASDFGLPTSNAAAAECLERVETALRDMGKTA